MHGVVCLVHVGWGNGRQNGEDEYHICIYVNFLKE